jgi:hypothetical protein
MIVKPNNIISDGLVLRLDPANIKSYQGTGTTFKDLTTNLSDFTLVGTPTYNVNGFFTFNGTNQYASRVNTASLKPATAISIEQWLNADNWNAGTSASHALREEVIRTIYGVEIFIVIFMRGVNI